MKKNGFFDKVKESCRAEAPLYIILSVLLVLLLLGCFIAGCLVKPLALKAVFFGAFAGIIFLTLLYQTKGKDRIYARIENSADAVTTRAALENFQIASQTVAFGKATYRYRAVFLLDDGTSAAAVLKNKKLIVGEIYTVKYLPEKPSKCVVLDTEPDIK
jgi:hypothetical protein